jgi:hypothetical protein
MYIWSRDCYKVKVPMIWLVTLGGLLRRDVCYNFTARTYLMTWENSTENLAKKLRTMEARHREEGGLLVVYVNSIEYVKDGCLILLAGYHG